MENLIMGIIAIGLIFYLFSFMRPPGFKRRESLIEAEGRSRERGASHSSRHGRQTGQPYFSLKSPSLALPCILQSSHLIVTRPTNYN